jgi:hypothetical protein
MDTTHKEIVLSIKPSRWFQFNWEIGITLQQKNKK